MKKLFKHHIPKKNAVIMLSSLIALLSATNVAAQNPWKPTQGPFGGTVPALAASANGIIFAGTQGAGIFRSEDAGTTWKTTNSGLENFDVRVLAFNLKEEIFAGTFGGGIFRSSDFGQNWQPVNSGLTGGNLAVNAIAIEPETQEIYIGTGNGVLRSVDNGDSWGPATAGLPPNVAVRALLINPFTLELLAGIPQAGLFRSADQGGKWDQIDNGFGAGTILVTGDNFIFAGTAEGLSLSRDNGGNWVPANNGLTVPVVTSLAIGPQGQILAGTDGGGVFQSTNFGTTWQLTDRGLTSKSILAFANGIDGDVFVGTNGASSAASVSRGVYRSTDGGNSWDIANDGLTNTRVSAMVVTDRGSVLAGTRGNGVFRTRDSGGTWDWLTRGVEIGAINHMLFDPQSQGAILVAVDAFGAGIFRSSNDGDTWVQFQKGLENAPPVQKLAINSTGELWAASNDLYISQDNGSSWAPVNVGLADELISELFVSAKDDIFISTTGASLLRSSDKGSTWQPADNGLQGARVSALTQALTGELLAATSSGALFLSNDDGQNWTAAGNIAARTLISSLQTAPNGVLLALAEGRGVFVSSDNGRSWQPYNDSLPVADVQSLTTDTQGQVFAGTDGKGVYINALPQGAQDVFWTANGSGNWSDPASWSTNTVPTALDRVFITRPGDYTVTLDIDASVQSLEIGAATSPATEKQVLNTNGRTLTLKGAGKIQPLGELQVFENSALNFDTLLENLGTLVWQGGAINGADTLDNAGEIVLSTTAEKSWQGGFALRNNGVVRFTDAFLLQSDGGASLLNAANGVLAIEGTLQWSESAAIGATTRLLNNGKISLSVSSAQATLDIDVQNNGQIDVQNSALRVSNGLVQGAGTITLDGGTIESPATLDIQGGLLRGTGVLAADVVMAGRLQPGSDIGLLEVRGDYTQTESGLLEMEIAGAAAFDRLTMSGSVNLDGSLEIVLRNGFIPGIGNRFALIGFAARTGDFASVSGLQISDVLRFNTELGANDYSLVVIAPALVLSPQTVDFGEALLGDSAVRTASLTNSGGVVVSVTAVAINGAHSTDFQLQGSGGAITLQPGQSTNLAIAFIPTAAGARTAELRVSSNAPSSPDVLQLRGVGVQPFDLFTQVDSGPVVADSHNSTSTNWVDFDLDGDLDLFVTNADASVPNQLFTNDGSGNFSSVDAGALTNDTAPSFAAIWGDVDNDGDADVFVANDDGTDNFFYLNNADGSFTKITTGDLVNDGGFSVAASWADFDNDGRLDLFVANRQGSNFLYHNEGAAGALSFHKITSGAIVTDAANSLACAWSDFDLDADLDLFVANGAGENNALYRNDGEGNFSKLTGSVVASDGGASNGASWGDFDNDGDTDLFVTNEGGEANFLYQNNGDGSFNKLADNVLTTLTGSAGSSWGDFDADGDLDLLVASNDAEVAENVLFLNLGDGTFGFEMLPNVLDTGIGARAASAADFDRDGDLDFVIANNGRNLLYQNNGNGNGWISIQLIGARTNRDAIGAKIKLQSVIDGQPRMQFREIAAQNGGGIGGQSRLSPFFGLGSAQAISNLEVIWPGGPTESLGAFAGKQFLTITEQITDFGEIEVVEPEQSEIGESLSIQVTPPTAFTPVSARLYYRAAGQAVYQSVPIGVSSGNLNVTIPPVAVTERGVQYYLEMSDGFSTITLPPANPQNNPRFIPARVRRMAAAIAPLAATFRMISVPMNLAQTAIDSVLLDDFGPYRAFPRAWRLFRWERLGYREYLDIEATFTPGTAFWLITREALPFDVDNATSVNAAASFEITLRPGWNQIANPFAFPVAWQNISADGAVQNPVFFNGTEYQFDVQVLGPWQGYFVFNLSPTPTVLTIPPIEAVLEGEKRGKASSKMVSDLQSGEFILQISARIEGEAFRDTQNYLGFRNGASGGLDSFDYFDAPAISDELSISIIENGDLFAGNFHPANNTGGAWDVRISSAVKGREIAVSLHQFGTLPAGFAIYLFDTQKQAVVPFHDGTFTLTSDDVSNGRTYKIVIGTAKDATDAVGDIPLVPVAFQLEQNYPNPFNPSTTIRYQLPETALVELVIFNQIGQHIATLIGGPQRTGSHQVSWDGRDHGGNPVASGIYLYRLRIGDRVLTRKMLLMR